MKKHFSHGRAGIRRTILVLLASTLLISSHARNAGADDLSEAKGPILLTLTGKLRATNRGETAAFDKEMLLSFPRHRIDTTTPWTDGLKRFEGILLSDLLGRVGAENSRTLLAKALNDYQVEIPAADAAEFGVLLAMNMDGEELSRRDKGPLWIVYPRDSIPRIQDERYDHRWIWQLEQIEVR